MDIINKTIGNKQIACCKNKEDLSIGTILTTIAIMKNILICDVTSSTHIEQFICYMTPQVKNNMIEANKKLRMYGKLLPTVFRF